ncbi:MAG: hypothetical protein IJ601_03935 [Acidaminococcaceae bacterium]|nr:hypothetical protein [Acidaminococcaceae bacterium]
MKCEAGRCYDQGRGGRQKTAALSGHGATVQGIAMITLLDLGFVVAAAMMDWQHPNSTWYGT